MAVCFTLVQKPLSKLYSVNHGGKPQVIAFTEKRMATTFMKWVKDMPDGSSCKKYDRPFQTMKVEGQITKSLSRRCQLNGLELLVFDAQCNVMPTQTKNVDTDDMMFHFENTMQYY